MPYRQRQQTINNTINVLGLREVRACWHHLNRISILIVQRTRSQRADNIIGNEFMSGISGGQRKRVAVAQELIHEPSVFYIANQLYFEYVL